MKENDTAKVISRLPIRGQSLVASGQRDSIPSIISIPSIRSRLPRESREPNESTDSMISMGLGNLDCAGGDWGRHLSPNLPPRILPAFPQTTTLLTA